MIICAYYGIETMLKNNVFKNKYVIMNPMDYKHREVDSPVPWEQEYVGYALLLSEIGFKVVILPNEEVLDEIERRNLTGIIYVYPELNQKDSWVEYLNGRLLAEETNNHIDGLVRAIYNYEYDIKLMMKAAKKGHSMEVVNKDITPMVVLLEGDVFGTKYESPLYKHIWSKSRDGKESNLLTDNLVEVVQDKQTGEYYLTMEDKSDSLLAETASRLMDKFIDEELNITDDYSITVEGNDLAIWGKTPNDLISGLVNYSLAEIVSK